MRVDTQSDTWISIEAFIAAEESAAMTQLRNPRNDLPATQYHRGIAHILSKLAALAQEDGGKPPEDVHVDYEVGGI